MNNKHNKIAKWLLFVFALAACRGGIPSVKSTPNIPQTIEVTRLVPLKTATHLPEIPASIPKPSVSSVSVILQVDTKTVQLDPAYFDGFVVLAQYYTLLDHGLYEEAYRLLSSSQQKRHSLGDYTDFYLHDLNGVKIIGIQPYDYWRAQDKMTPLPAPVNELRFVVFLTTFHKGAAWNAGGTPTPYGYTGFESLILENDEWKIDEFNTSPWITFP